MFHSSRVTGLLDLAVAKASQLPDSQQDKIGKAILAMISEEGETLPTPEDGAVGIMIEVLQTVLVAKNFKKMLILIIVGCIFFVQASATILNGISVIVRESRTRLSPAPTSESQARPRQPEKPAVGEGKVAEFGDDIRQALEKRAALSERQNQRLEAYYSLWEVGLFEERMAIRLAGDPTHYQTQVVAKINRAASLGPSEVSTKLGALLLTLQKFTSVDHTVNDVSDYYEAKEATVTAMRRAIQASVPDR